ncbi:hypothetical protein V3F56_03920 [Moorellaceae bacterium AZ2]
MFFVIYGFNPVAERLERLVHRDLQVFLDRMREAIPVNNLSAAV